MTRLDDPSIDNPFGWRLDAITDSTTTPARRAGLTAELLVCEAEELARGWRHLTITHGDPDDLDASRQLSAFYETLRELASATNCFRARGQATFVTLTVAGPRADDSIDVLAAFARAANPGTWTISRTPYPLGLSR
jgi:hypothetical protein